METGDKLPVLWDDRVQLFLQHDLHISLLQNAGGGLV